MGLLRQLLIRFKTVIYRFIYLKFNNTKIIENENRELYLIDKHVFVGYYDFNPLHIKGDKLVAHAANVPLGTPKVNSSIDIGYFIKKKRGWRFIKIGETIAWCWQLGSRLRWYPNTSSNQLIYNDIDRHTGKVISKIYDIEKKDCVKILPFPFYDISKDGKYFLFLNFYELQKMRPGYGYIHPNSNNETNQNINGVFLGNTVNLKTSTLFSLDQIKRYKTDDSMKNANHYVNHLSFSPDGKGFIFLHLWVKNNKRYSRLFYSSIDDPILTLIHTESPVSHYAWKEDDSLLVFAKVPERNINRLILYNLKTLQFKTIGEESIRHDGHPTFIDNGKKLLYDSYPDKFREQKLLVYDIERDSFNEIGSFYRKWKFRGEIKCDLHPRFDEKNKIIVIDDIRKKHRCIRLINHEYQYNN